MPMPTASPTLNTELIVNSPSIERWHEQLQSPETPHNLEIPNAVRLNVPGLELHVLDDFLDEPECEALINTIRQQLRPSTLSSAESDQTFRTSRTCDLGEINAPLIGDIDRRICQLVGIDSSYTEILQGQYYEVGERFKAHTDYFEAHEIGAESHMGQRTYTMMIYLNDVPEGGETEFPRVGATFTPKRGRALIWSSLKKDGRPNIKSLHEAHPVKAGYKAVITKWFRVKSSRNPGPAMRTKTANEMVRNYTKTGLGKSRIPAPLHRELIDFLTSHHRKAVAENVPGGFIVSDNEGGGNSSQLLQLPLALRQKVHDTLKPTAEAWSRQSLVATYVYGIRLYRKGAILKSHRDRFKTHIISIVLNVDQDVDEDWPLVIEDNYKRIHHVILKPGEMILYEGGRLLHGRPIPLNGRYFANIFCHYRPNDSSSLAIALL